MAHPPANVGDTRDMGFIPGVRKILWSRKWQPNLVFLPEEPMDRGTCRAPVYKVAELDTTERLNTHTHKLEHRDVATG